ncbi:MAG TPA: hypothetical protein VK327_16730 [Candidatus Paceibacterota bacterium]|nr:hypothetical protein [Candidatus Paceibacterota bacterium]
MSQEDQKQLDQLQVQLTCANTEARLYRGLFWFLLTFAGAAAILYLLQR